MPLGCAYSNGVCSTLLNTTLVNRLNERDLSYDASLAAIYIAGIDLNTGIFDQYGYIMNSTKILKDALDAGLRRMHLDVYWDSVSSTWTLCPIRPPPKQQVPSNTTSPSSSFSTPDSSNKSLGLDAMYKKSFGSSPLAESLLKPSYVSNKINNSSTNGYTSSDGNTTISPLCDYKFNFDDLIEAIYDYIKNSDSNTAASLLYLHLRPKILPLTNASNTDQSQLSKEGVSSLSSAINLSGMTSRIMTPEQVHYEEERSKLSQRGVYYQTPRSELWPNLQTALISNGYRIVISYNDTLVSKIPDLNKIQTLAFAGVPTIENPSKYSIEELSKLNFTDTYVSDLDGWQEARKLGVAPVLRNSKLDFYSSEMWKILNFHSYWAWEQDEPQLYSIRQRQDMLINGHIRQSDLDACAIFTPEGFTVADCNLHYPILCVNKKNSFDWTFSNSKETYFDSDCPSGYSFGVPTTPLEARYLRENMFNNGSNKSWVDFNSLFLPNCWVTGGTNAVCPYNIQEYSRNGIGYIVVSSAVAVFGFIFIWLFEWDRGRSPLMKKPFKRIASKEEFEGIPS